MNTRNELIQPKASPQQSRSYTTPKLVVYGDVRHLTQGGTQGLAESTNNNINFMN